MHATHASTNPEQEQLQLPSPAPHRRLQFSLQRRICAPGWWEPDIGHPGTSAMNFVIFPIKCTCVGRYFELLEYRDTHKTSKNHHAPESRLADTLLGRTPTRRMCISVQRLGEWADFLVCLLLIMGLSPSSCAAQLQVQRKKKTTPGSGLSICRRTAHCVIV